MTFKERLEKAKQKVDKLHWKVQTSGEWGALCVPYLNATQVIHILNDSFEVWNDSYELKEHIKEIRTGKGRNKNGEEYEYEYLYENYIFECTITIHIENGHVITRKGYGEGNDMKSAESDALKRAAKKYNVGEFLFDFDQVWFDKNQVIKDGKSWFPVDENGKVLKYTEQLTKYINSHQKLSRKSKEYENKQEPDSKISEPVPAEKKQEPRLKKSSSKNNTNNTQKDTKELFKELEHEVQNNENIDGTIISMFSDRTERGKKYRGMVFNKVLGVSDFKDVTSEGLQAFILNIKKSDNNTLKILDGCVNDLLESI